MAYSVLIYNIWRVHHYTTLARLHTLTHTFFWNKKIEEKDSASAAAKLESGGLLD